MKTNEERTAALHKKMRKLRRKKDLQGLYFAGGICTMLTVILTVLVRTLSLPVSGSTASMYTASSLLDESAGGYVLTALCAFTLGVTVTAAARYYLKQKKEHEKHPDSDKQQKDEDV